jgi:NADH-quinone oxidoreductase subunit E
VATFYAQFKLTPLGKKVIRVCAAPPATSRLGKVLAENRETARHTGRRDDARPEYTLETVACIGACALAPTMTLDGETFGKMTTKKVAEVLGDDKKDS